MSWDDAGSKKEVAESVARWIRRGDTVERLERFEGDPMPEWVCRWNCDDCRPAAKKESEQEVHVMRAKLTAWFPADLKPVYPGIYQTFDPFQNRKWFNRWTGLEWIYGGATPDEAAKESGKLPEINLGKWRGLASRPADQALGNESPVCPQCHGKPTLQSECDCLPF
ncbi:hypothetical protein [Paucimonas lemoignei]|nr:hypothetical protein [Paucimonas lemoignei]